MFSVAAVAVRLMGAPSWVAIGLLIFGFFLDSIYIALLMGAFLWALESMK